MKELGGHIESGCKAYPKNYPPTEQLTLKKQYDVLSNLSNNHKAPYLAKDGTVYDGHRSENRIECCRAYQCAKPLVNDGKTVSMKRSPYKPYSFRNRLTYYLKHPESCSPSYIADMLKYHYDGIVPSTVEVAAAGHAILDTVAEDVPYVEEVPATIPQPGPSEPTHSVNKSTNSATVLNMSAPATYNEVFRAGIAQSKSAIRWRYHSENRDILTMHEYDIRSGRVLSNIWCHIHCQRLAERIVCQCTCKAYSMNFTIDTNSEMYNTPCLHVRYYKEHIMEHVDELFREGEIINESFLFQKLKVAKQFNGCAVTLLSNEDSVVKKFSILSVGNHDHSIVELNSENFLVCQSSVCQIGKCHKRKVSSLGNGTICPHLELMRANEELWQNLVFPPNIKSSSIDKVIIKIQISCREHRFYK